jgi:hypothetical protein
MRCVILQPSYIPWRGYFHQIQKADKFIFYDDVQYDTRGWRNRNRLKTHRGPIWLTIPVNKRSVQVQKTPIHQIKIAWDTPWNKNHWKTIVTNYAKAPFFSRYAPLIESFYTQQSEYLADFTIELTIHLAQELGIAHTQFLRSSSLLVTGTKTERLINILNKVGADHYITGPAAQAYLDEAAFLQAGIHLEYMVYDYIEYPQLYPPFDPQVSILDLLFMTGPAALSYFTLRTP